LKRSNPSPLSTIHQTLPEGKVNTWPEKKYHVWFRFFSLIVIIGGLALALYETDLIRLFCSKQRLLHFLQSLGPWGFAGLILLQALQVILAPIPGEVTGLLGGFVYGPLLGTLLSTIGLTIGSCAAFAIARFFGRPLVEKFVPEPALKRFGYLLHQKGAFLAFLLFLIPGIPKDSLCYILGLGQLSTLEFIAIGGVGRLFGTILLSFGGNFIRLDQYGRFFTLLGVAAVGVLVALVYKDRLERFFREWHERNRRNRVPEAVRIDVR
jgi:uncharacterized membrane protein YdjX (TVP38/TMEM64 family)